MLRIGLDWGRKQQPSSIQRMNWSRHKADQAQSALHHKISNLGTKGSCLYFTSPVILENHCEPVKACHCVLEMVFALDIVVCCLVSVRAKRLVEESSERFQNVVRNNMTNVSEGAALVVATRQRNTGGGSSYFETDWIGLKEVTVT